MCPHNSSSHIYINWNFRQLDLENTAHSSEGDCMQRTYINATRLQEGGGEEEMNLEMRWIRSLLKTVGFISLKVNCIVDRSIDLPGLAHSSEIRSGSLLLLVLHANKPGMNLYAIYSHPHRTMMTLASKWDITWPFPLFSFILKLKWLHFPTSLLLLWYET